MPICEFATVDSDKELVVHGANIASHEDFQWLAETLGVYPSDEMLAILWLPNNETLVLVLFSQLHSKYDGMIPGEILEINENTIPETVRRGPPEAMPDAGFIDPDTARWALFALHARGESIGGWTLPKRDIWLPMTPSILSHLQHLVGRGPSKNRCVDVVVPRFPSETMNKLAELVAALERHLRLLEEERGAWATRRLSLEYAHRLIDLEVWDWSNTSFHIANRAERLQRLSELTTAMDNLDAAANEASPAIDAEHGAAVELLAFLKPGSKAAREIEDVLDVLAVQPHAFRSEQVDDVFEFLERSFSVLSSSSVAERFVQEHLISLIQAAAESLPPELEQEFTEGYGDNWKPLWQVDWRDSVNALWSKGGVADPSPYAKVVALQKYYKAGLFVIQAALSHATLPILLARLSDYAKTEEALRPLAHSLLSCLLRGLLASGAIHRGAPGQVLFAGQDVTRWFKACARALGGRPTAASMTEIARELKALKLEDAVKNVRRFAYARFFFSAVSTLTAYEDTWSDTWENWMKLYGAAIETSEELVKLTRTVALQGMIGMEDRERALELVGKRLAMMSAAISLAVAGGDTLQNWYYMSPRRKLASALATASAATALAQLLPFVTASARWMRMLGIAGVVLGVVEFALGQLISATTAEAESVFQKYLEFALDDGPYRSPATAEKRAALVEAAERAVKSDAIVRLGRQYRERRDAEGERDRIPEGSPPTWFYAHSKGFAAEVIAKLFESDILDVIGAGIPLGPGYKEDSSGAPTQEQLQFPDNSGQPVQGASSLPRDTGGSGGG